MVGAPAVNRKAVILSASQYPLVEWQTQSLSLLRFPFYVVQAC